MCKFKKLKIRLKININLFLFSSLNYLDKYLQKSLPGVRNDQWQQLLSYRSSLMQTNEIEMPLNRVAGGQSYSRGQNDDQGI